MSMELIVSEFKKQEIQIKNYEDLNKELDENLKKYEGLVLTEDNRKDIASDKAKLNKLVKAIDDRRIALTKEYNEPIQLFINQCNTLKEKVLNVSNGLNEQIKAADLKELEEKKKEIKKLFDEIITNEYIKYENIYNEKWELKGSTLKKVEAEMKEINENFNTDIEAIKNLNSKNEAVLIKKYIETRNMSAVLQEEARIKELQEIKEKYEQEKEQERQKQLEVQTSTVTANFMNTPLVEEILHRGFEVWGTKEQIIALGEFMNQNNIKFKKIEGVK